MPDQDALHKTLTDLSLQHASSFNDPPSLQLRAPRQSKTVRLASAQLSATGHNPGRTCKSLNTSPSIVVSLWS